MKRRLLVAVDGEKTSVKTVRYVARACAGIPADQLEIVLFHVLAALPPSLEAGDSSGLVEVRARIEAERGEAAEKLLTGLKTELVTEGVPAACVQTDWFEDDDIAGLILEAARQRQCDTIVLGRRGKSMVGQFFGGGVAEKILRHPTGFTIWLVE
jgi:nucleotide-binding universal stress UspA family protein